MKILRIIAVMLALALLAQAALAGSGRTTLLATSDPFEGGVTADLQLETKPGTGKVFIESSPLTKIDTQISTRFAKEVACNYLGKSCNEMDFFYTIKARASIVGGPSAGAAMAALTVAVLEDTQLNESVALTGTINSGNVIGPVGGITDKIEAASKAGIKKVLIPKGEQSSFARNFSIDPVAYGESFGVEVVEVFSLDEAMLHFAGKTFQPESGEIAINPKYNDIMEELADSLCTRTDDLEEQVGMFSKEKRYNETLQQVIKIADNLTRQGQAAAGEGSNYAAASYCFGANVRYQFLSLAAQNLSSEAIAQGLEKVEGDAAILNGQLESATTASDAQILAIVLDRIDETAEHINKSRQAMLQNNSLESTFELAFATERLKSAESWSSFFGVISQVEITEEMLKDACLSKLGEAQERSEYAAILLGRIGTGAREKLAAAQKQFENEKYVQCLHSSTIAKAEADTLLSVYGVRDDEVLPITERKIEAARASIARQSEKSIFPIVGYSYFEYANSLKETDKYSALLFSEYALEFSNLDIYFKPNASQVQQAGEKQQEKASPQIETPYIIALIMAVAITFYMLGRQSRRKKRLLINTAARKRKR